MLKNACDCINIIAGDLKSKRVLHYSIFACCFCFGLGFFEHFFEDVGELLHFKSVLGHAWLFVMLCESALESALILLFGLLVDFFSGAGKQCRCYFVLCGVFCLGGETT